MTSVAQEHQTATDRFDAAQVERFLGLMAHPGALLGIATIERPNPGSKTGGGAVTRTLHAWPDRRTDVLRRLRVAAERGHDAYLCPVAFATVAGGQRIENAASEQRLAYADGDGADLARLNPTYLVESSPGRHHGYWHLSAPVTPGELTELNRRLAHATGADPSGADLTQLLRIPGTRNLTRPGLPTVRLLVADGPEHDPGALLASLPPTPSPAVVELNPAPRTADTGQEPPLPLAPEALARWRGERVSHERGAIDRSRTLYRIGCDLANAGLAERLIPQELAERDRALGATWPQGPKYAGRPDADARYRAIAARAVAGRRPTAPAARPAVVEPDPAPDPDDGPCRNPRCERDRQELARLRRRHAATVQAIANPNAGGDVGGKAAVLVVGEALHRARASGTSGPVPITGPRIADGGAGAPRMSEKTAQKCIRAWQGAGINRFRKMPVTWEENGRPVTRALWHVDLGPDPEEGASTLLEELAAVNVNADHPRQRGGSGPNRPKALPVSCPDCGGETVAVCRACGAMHEAALVEPEATGRVPAPELPLRATGTGGGITHAALLEPGTSGSGRIAAARADHEARTARRGAHAAPAEPDYLDCAPPIDEPAEAPDSPLYRPHRQSGTNPRTDRNDAPVDLLGTQEPLAGTPGAAPPVWQ